MPKLKNANATFWVIFKHCDIFKFGIELKVLLSFRDAKPDHPAYLVVTDKLDRQVKDCKDHLVFPVKVFKVNLEEMEKKVKPVSKD